MKIRKTLLPALTTILVLSGCGVSVQKKPSPQKFIAAHVKKVKPMMIDSALANWKAANTGDPKYYDRFSKLQLKVRQVYSNPDEFALVVREVEIVFAQGVLHPVRHPDDGWTVDVSADAVVHFGADDRVAFESLEFRHGINLS